MRILIVYNSAFGNTEHIPHAIDNTHGSQKDAEIPLIRDMKLEHLTCLYMLIAGFATQAFKPTKSIINFLKKILENCLKGSNVTTFSTSFTMKNIKKSSYTLPFFVRLFGYAPSLSQIGLRKNEEK